jgi:hypothetical protein
MNDYYGALRWRLEAHPTATLLQQSLHLNEILCSPLKYGCPREEAEFLLSEWRTWNFKPVVQ